MRKETIELLWNKNQFFLTALTGWLSTFLGGMDGLLCALAACMVLDYITGVLCAVSDRKLSSAVGFRGIARKGLMLCLVGLAHLLDTRCGSGSTLRSAVIAFYLSNEGVSILENAARLGLPVPDGLREILSQLHKKI